MSAPTNAELLAAIEDCLRFLHRLEDREDRLTQKEIDAITTELTDLLNRAQPNDK